MKKYIALFDSSRTVMKADCACAKALLKSVIMPVPVEYASQCGMCLVFEESEKASFERIMAQEKIECRLCELGMPATKK